MLLLRTYTVVFSKTDEAGLIGLWRAVFPDFEKGNRISASSGLWLAVLYFTP